MGRSDFLAGIKPIRVVLFTATLQFLALTLASGSLLLVSSCRSSSLKDKSDALDESELNNDDLDTSEDEGNLYPHPREANKWETKVLLLTGEGKPTRSSLKDCRDEVIALTEDSGNAAQLRRVQESLKETVSQDLKLYHWCFYSLIGNVDRQIESYGVSIDQKINFFYKTMSSLWALAHALDAKLQVDTYFDYLRKRYIEISTKAFGRPLEVVGPSYSVSGSRGKAAKSIGSEAE